MLSALFASLHALGEAGPTIDEGTRQVGPSELHDRVQALAGRLPEGAVVALDLPRGADWVVGLLAVRARGGVAVLLHPDGPPARNRSLAARAGATHALVSGDDVISTWGPSRRLPQETSHVVFTSGSTGRPKGVLCTEDGLTGTLRAQIELFGVSGASRVGWMLSPGFDASLSDVGVALLAGATLVPSVEPPSAAAVGALVERGITHVDLPPVLLSRWGDRPVPQGLVVVTGGEVLPAAAARRWSAAARLFSVYGPTEASVCTHAGLVGEMWVEGALGRPLAGVKERVVDGVLWIGGPGLALGYLDEPELEAARFVVEGGERWYLTGDRVDATPRGLVFRGRVDRQRKVNGVLVCPEEIERVLRDAGAGEARVDWEDGGFTAWVGGDVRAEVLRRAVEASLPAAAVPRRWVEADVPRGPQGKPTPVAAGSCDGVWATARERSLADLARELFGVCPAPTEPWSLVGLDSLDVLDLVAEGRRRGLVSGVGDGTTLRALAADPSSLRWADLDRGTDASRGVPATDGVVLVTGASGHLGRHVVPALLRAGREVWCLTRPPAVDLVRARFGDAVRIVPGDVTAPLWGLSEALLRVVGDRVGILAHLAARVHLTDGYAALAPSNAQPLVEALRLLALGRPKVLHHASSLAPFVSAHPKPAFAREAPLGTTLAPGTQFMTAYAASKAAAEALAPADGRVAHHRFGLLVGETVGGRTAPHCQLAAVIRTVARLGAAPDVEGWFDATPVDVAAGAFVQGVVQGTGVGHVHIACRAPTAWHRLLDALDDERVPVRRLGSDAWHGALRGAPWLGGLGVLALAEGPESLFLAGGIRWETAELDRRGRGIDAPDGTLLRTLVRGALGRFGR